MDQMKMAKKLYDAQKQLKKEIIEVVSSDENPEVTMRFNAAMEIKSVEIDPEFLKPENAEELNNLVKSCIRDGLTQAQTVAQNKIQPMLGGLGKLPF
ncbi:YbaB/EbfC family nucleoid-associated protein [Candidatus Saccharibacteria bacterium]|nr:YbaB/EbfC family nucleoid-associated protein [Candidatus Saccharibacteria bacterium]